MRDVVHDSEAFDGVALAVDEVVVDLEVDGRMDSQTDGRGDGEGGGWWFGNTDSHCWMVARKWAEQVMIRMVSGLRKGQSRPERWPDRWLDSHSHDNGGKVIVGWTDS